RSSADNAQEHGSGGGNDSVCTCHARGPYRPHGIPSRDNRKTPEHEDSQGFSVPVTAPSAKVPEPRSVSGSDRRAGHGIPPRRRGASPTPSAPDPSRG